VNARMQECKNARMQGSVDCILANTNTNTNMNSVNPTNTLTNTIPSDQPSARPRPEAALPSGAKARESAPEAGPRHTARRSDPALLGWPGRPPEPLVQLPVWEGGQEGPQPDSGRDDRQLYKVKVKVKDKDKAKVKVNLL
jgi:hypothetical protein